MSCPRLAPPSSRRPRSSAIAPRLQHSSPIDVIVLSTSESCDRRLGSTPPSLTHLDRCLTTTSPQVDAAVPTAPGAHSSRVRSDARPSSPALFNVQCTPRPNMEWAPSQPQGHRPA
ncbi:hypothetical protein PVAP13_2KG259458 [Panicum virgatum]|uniref:Uncharacterized protein n=1 Tax=Panicum virgatum TaxID=38727 RepID=A0A8T0W446_PANVG|nr:hypothetical protein PVAP13_2KG259458 [Panicum virgatum]